MATPEGPWAEERQKKRVSPEGIEPPLRGGEQFCLSLESRMLPLHHGLFCRWNQRNTNHLRRKGAIAHTFAPVYVSYSVLVLFMCSYVHVCVCVSPGAQTTRGALGASGGATRGRRGAALHCPECGRVPEGRVHPLVSLDSLVDSLFGDVWTWTRGWVR